MTEETPRLKLLLVVPHPDDEVYGAGGTIMEFEGAGQSCGLLTLTRGEAGRTLGLAETPEELADLREVELSACLDELGITVHEQCAFPDKALAETNFDELVEVIRGALERYRPEILLTFPPNGSNGHPDHVTTHRAAKTAWEALPKAERPTLWYYALSSPPENEALRAEWLPPNLERNVTAQISRKLRAIACHRTQALSSIDFIRKFPERITVEAFHVVGNAEE